MHPSIRQQKKTLRFIWGSLDEGISAVTTAALGDIAQAKGTTQISSGTGLSREIYY
jgi:DNA-binding phage protein